MAIKKGYKQTEIGIIPKDWEVKSILEISNPVRGASPRPAGSPLYFNGDFMPWLTVASLTNIPSSQILVFKTDEFLTEMGTFFSRTLDENTLIIANSGATLGIAKILAIKCCANDGIAALLNLNHNYDKYYICYFINTRTTYLREVVATGNGQPNLNTTLIGNIRIPFPPTLTEQTNITSVLHDVDSLITILDEKITKKRMIKQGVMQQLLTAKKRLHGFSSEWEEKKLGEIIRFERGQMITSSQLINGNIPVIAGGKTAAGFHNISNRKKNTITISASGANAGYVAFHTSSIFASDCSTISENESIDIKFIFYLMQFKQDEIYKAQTGGAQPHIHPKDLNTLEVLYPHTKSEQTAISQILSDIDDEITALEAKRDKYKQVKKGMMQELLTGKIRLVENIEEKTFHIVEKETKKPKHNDQINEAVVISFLVNKFATEQYPLSRFRYTKYAYLLHRRHEQRASGYYKHAAGPYKPENRYKGAESIAIKNKYIDKVENPKSGKDAFIVNDNIEKALIYFIEWYGTDIQQWIEQFRYYKNDYLEVLTTVDESIIDLTRMDKPVNVENIREYIAMTPQWKGKLDKPYFSDFNIQKALNESYKLF